MPFGSNKSKKEKEPPKKTPGGYPTQSPYPAQAQPSAPAGYPDQPPPYTAAGQGPPPGQAPPPHYAPPAGHPQYQQPGRPAYYPQQPQYGVPPAGMYYPQAAAAYPPIPPGAQVVGHGTFDAGARFNSGAGMNIPPPPPGAMPTAAQVAAAYGGTVTMAQNRSNFFSGGSDGGVSTHID